MRLSEVGALVQSRRLKGHVDRERHCNSNVVNILFLAGVAALISSQAFAQTDASLATPTGHEVNASVGSYTYT